MRKLDKKGTMTFAGPVLRTALRDDPLEEFIPGVEGGDYQKTLDEESFEVAIDALVANFFVDLISKKSGEISLEETKQLIDRIKGDLEIIEGMDVLCAEEKALVKATILKVYGRENKWPVNPVSASYWDSDTNELVSVDNGIGRGEHGETMLILEAMRRQLPFTKIGEGMTVRGEWFSLERFFQRLVIRSKSEHLKDNMDIWGLGEFSKKLGSPLEGKTIVCSMYPCEACARKLEEIGVEKTLYFCNHHEKGRHRADWKGKMKIEKVPGSCELSVLGEYDTYYSVREPDGDYRQLSAAIRRISQREVVQGGMDQGEFDQRLNRALEGLTVGSKLGIEGYVLKVIEEFGQ